MENIFIEILKNEEECVSYLENLSYNDLCDWISSFKMLIDKAKDLQKIHKKREFEKRLKYYYENCGNMDGYEKTIENGSYDYNFNNKFLNYISLINKPHIMRSDKIQKRLQEYIKIGIGEV